MLWLTLRVPVNATRLGAPVPELLLDPDAGLEANADTGMPRIELTEPSASAALPFEQPAGPDGDYALPETELLNQSEAGQAIDQKELMEKAKAITSKAAEFRVTGEVVAIHPGPVVATFEFRPGTGVKYSRITNLEDDLSLALKAESIRIARLPGKATVGIEVPNNDRATIGFRDIIESAEFQGSKSKLTLALGKQIHGETTVTDLARMPHLLIAGTTRCRQERGAQLHAVELALQGHARRSEGRADRPQTPGIRSLQGHPASAHARRCRAQVGRQRAGLGCARDGATLQAAGGVRAYVASISST